MTEIKNIPENHGDGRNSLQSGFHSVALSKLKKISPTVGCFISIGRETSSFYLVILSF
jgi:hypothetical protein